VVQCFLALDYAHAHFVEGREINPLVCTEEFSALSPTAKYCVGLARYTQSPLNEYAALGTDITAISFDEDVQLLVGLSAEIISINSHLRRCRQKGCCSARKTREFLLQMGHKYYFGIKIQTTALKSPKRMKRRKDVSRKVS
jgi:hypothetical protein